MASMITNLTLRFTLLRIIYLSAILQLIQMLVGGKTYLQDLFYSYYATYAGLGLILVHHIASAFGPRFSLPGLLDLLLIVVEIGLSVPKRKLVPSWDTQRAVIYLALIWTICITLLLAALLRIGEAIQRGPRYLIWTRYDITGAKWNQHHESGSKNVNARAEGASPDEPLRVYQVLFGVSPWDVHFVGETRVIVVLRGFCSVLLVVFIPLFALFVLVIEPVRETGLTPYKGIKSPKLPKDFGLSFESDPVWNVAIMRMTADNNTSFTVQAVNVILLQNPNNASSNPPCTPDSDVWWTNDLTKYQVDSLVYYCPMNSQWTYFPDILVTVNFSMLDIPSDSIVDGAINSVQVLHGLTNTTDYIFQTTSPTMLLPGMNVVGISRLSIRQRFGKAAAAAFGIIDDYDTFIFSEIVDLSPDPQASISKLIPRSPEIATIRIISQYDLSETNVVRDFREKTVLQGFSTIGGLWAFLGGIFAALFGSTVMRILLDIKPISFFGLTRAFKGDGIREAYLRKYPRLITDFRTRLEDRGLVSFISDYLVDFSFLTEREGQSRLDDEDMPMMNVVQARTDSVSRTIE